MRKKASFLLSPYGGQVSRAFAPSVEELNIGTCCFPGCVHHLNLA